MASTAEKATTTASAPPQAVNQPFFRKAGEDDFFRPAPAAPAVQLKMAVNQVGDPLEREADRMADQVMRAPAPEDRQRAGPLQPGAALQRKEEGGAAPTVDGGLQSAIAGKSSGGQPMGADVRAFMEPRFNADFSKVRIHDDAESASISNRLSARAFTHQNHVFFSRNQYQPGTGEGRQLLAHELTHTIQQGHAVQRSAQVSVTASAPPIQRLGIQDALDYFAEKAANIPGYTLLTFLLGFDPISQRDVERTGANLLRALVQILPGGKLITDALEKYGVFEKAGSWVDQQLATLGDIGSAIVAALDRFIDSLGWRDIFHLGRVWDRAKAIFTTPIDRLKTFGVNLAIGLMKLVRDALLRPLAALAEGKPGYDLLKVVLGEDPITHEPVAQTPDNLIGGFMKMIHQEEVWRNIQEGKAVQRAMTWFMNALKGLLAMVKAIPGRIISTITSITWRDVLSITGVFGKILKVFVNIATDFFTWAGDQVIGLLEIIFSVVAPGAVPYVSKAKGAFRTIITKPVVFVRNLVRAGKRGFELFSANIKEHLKEALIKWLTGPLAEAKVYIPQSFSLLEIIKLVLSVLGLTWQHVREKLVKIIPEPVLAGLEKSSAILVTLVKEGPAAAWEQIKTELAGVKDMLIAQVTGMITTEVVKAGVAKLVSMLNPAGAVIQAIIAIYHTITFFIQKIRDIGEVVGSFIDSVAAIAAGNVENAAKKVEKTMSNTLKLILAFLAKFAGLGSVPDKLVGIINRVREPVDKVLDKIVEWLGKMLAKGKEVARSVFEWWKARLGFTNAAGDSHTLSFKGDETAAALMIESTPLPLEAYLDAYEKKQKKLSREDAKTISAIRARANKIQKIKDASESKAAGEKNKALFEEIVPLLKELGGEEPPATVATWDNPNEDGVEMDAKPLSINPGSLAGSRPTQESMLWKRVNAMFPGQYVRGHLLNHNVHGPGVKQNLIPITREANASMESIGEHHVKQFVLGENQIIEYKVTMVSFHGKISVRGYEDIGGNRLPKSIRMEAYAVKQNGKKTWIRGKKLFSEIVSSVLPKLPRGLP